MNGNDGQPTKWVCFIPWPATEFEADAGELVWGRVFSIYMMWFTASEYISSACAKCGTWPCFVLHVQRECEIWYLQMHVNMCRVNGQ